MLNKRKGDFRLAAHTNSGVTHFYNMFVAHGWDTFGEFSQLINLMLYFLPTSVFILDVLTGLAASDVKEQIFKKKSVEKTKKSLGLQII